MELGIKAKEIMNDNFPILDSSLTLETCIKKLDNRYEGCIILDNGFIHNILSYDDLLEAFFERKTKNLKLKEIKARRNFAFIHPDVDVFDVINLMNKNKVDFIIVQNEKNFGLITKKEISEISEFLFDKLGKEAGILAQ